MRQAPESLVAGRKKIFLKQLAGRLMKREMGMGGAPAGRCSTQADVTMGGSLQLTRRGLSQPRQRSRAIKRVTQVARR